MIVTCEHCSARYKLDPSRITGRGVRITCPSCKHIFIVYRPGSAGAESRAAGASATPLAAVGSSPTTSPPPPVSASFGASAGPVASTAPVSAGAYGGRGAAAVQPAAPKLDLDTIDFSSVGIQAWKVKVRIGLVYDFSDYKTLARYIKDGRVGQDDQISHDGKTWTRLGDIADLQQHFLDVYVAARDRREAGASGSNFEEDDPTRIVGVESVSRTLGDLGRGAPTQEAEPAPDHAEAPGGPRFDDPFEKARARREKNTRPIPTSSRTVPIAPPPSAARGDRGPSMAVVVLLGLALGGLAAGGWFYVQQRQAPTVGETPAQQQLREAALRAEAEKAKADMREQYKEDLAGALEPTDIKPMFEENPEDVRIPVGPGQRGGARPATGATGSASSGAGTSARAGTPTGAEAGMTIGSTTPADHYSAGRSAFNAGNYPLAVQGFRQAVSGAPSNAEYRYYLGLALDRAGSGEAVRELVEAGRLGSRSAYKLLGDILGRQGDVAGAVGYYQQYLATNPSDAAAVQAEIDRLTR